MVAGGQSACVAGSWILFCVIELTLIGFTLSFSTQLEMSTSSTLVCASCGTTLEEGMRCSRCKNAVYCNAECQRSHWKLHKLDCRPTSQQAPDGPTVNLLAVAEEKNQAGNKAYSEGNYPEAVACYTAAIQTGVQVAKYWGNRSQAYLLLEQYDAAEVDARRALDLESENEKFFLRLLKAMVGQKCDMVQMGHVVRSFPKPLSNAAMEALDDLTRDYVGSILKVKLVPRLLQRQYPKEWKWFLAVAESVNSTFNSVMQRAPPGTEYSTSPHQIIATSHKIILRVAEETNIDIRLVWYFWETDILPFCLPKAVFTDRFLELLHIMVHTLIEGVSGSAAGRCVTEKAAVIDQIISLMDPVIEAYIHQPIRGMSARAAALFLIEGFTGHSNPIQHCEVEQLADVAARFALQLPEAPRKEFLSNVLRLASNAAREKISAFFEKFTLEEVIANTPQ